MRIRSGWNWASTSFRALWKSPTREQQMHPADISLICTPDSFRKPPSMLISPNSFSISTSFSPGKASASSFLIRVVLPAPRKPETMSILVMVSSPLFKIFTVLYLIIKLEKSNSSRKKFTNSAISHPDGETDLRTVPDTAAGRAAPPAVPGESGLRAPAARPASAGVSARGGSPAGRPPAPGRRCRRGEAGRSGWAPPSGR